MIDLCKMLQFILILPIRRGRGPRQCWVRNWILEKPLFGQYEVLMDQLLNSDLYGYSNFMKEKTRFREPLPAGLKVVITLRYMATGDS